MKKRRLIKYRLWTVGVFVVLLILVPTRVHTRTRFTCVLCRVEQTEYRLLGYGWSQRVSNEFTAWYNSHRPVHDHFWERSSCVRGRNVFGMTVSWGCGPIHPVGTLSPRTELEFVELVDGATLGKFFNDIISPNREVQKKAVEEARETVLEHL